jgi:hypothetical protein
MLTNHRSNSLLKKIYRKIRQSTSKVYQSLLPKQIQVAQELHEKYKEYEQKLAESKKSCANSNLMTYDEFNVKNHKKSDTLFILGSGASIGDYTQEMWEHIKSHDTFGFNHWYFHKHIPTYYMFELPKEHLMKEAVIHNLKVVSEKYWKIPKFIKPYSPQDSLKMEEIPDFLINKLYYVPTYGIPKKSINNYKKALNTSNIPLLRGRIKFPDLNSQSRCSLDQVINFGIASNYKKIVLCGVDLTNTNHFFRRDDFYLPTDMQELPVYQKGGIHKTLDKNYGEITIDEIVNETQRKITKKRNIEMFVALNTSGLAGILPTYFKDKT